MPDPIVTLTANPLAEITAGFARPLQPGRTQRATAQSFQVGGKGFNVARMLARLGVPATALSFAGGATGEACRAWLEAHAGFAWKLFPTQADTRAGMVVRSDDGTETTLLGPDCRLDGPAAQAAASHLHHLPRHTRVAVCGSFPDWEDRAITPLRRAVEILAESGRLVVDSYGPVLRDLVDFPLPLVKINRDEFTALARSTDTEPTLAAAQRRFPVRRWVVTDGPRAIEYADDHVAGEVTPPSVAEVSPTGSGDVFLATLLAAGDALDGASLVSAIHRAAENAARNAAHPGIAEFEPRS